MKKILTILTILFSATVFAQSSDGVVNALKEGSAAKFASYFSNNIDLKFPQKDELKNVSKADAQTAVTNFFTSNSINGFEVISQREMGGTMYIAGKLKSASQSYNLTVMLKSSSNNMSIITVRIS